MVSGATILILSLVSTPVIANMSDWAKQAVNSSAYQSAKIPKAVAILSYVSPAILSPDLPAAKMNRDSFITFVAGKDFEWTLKINSSKSPGDDKMSRINFVMDITNAEILMLTPRNGNWELYSRRGAGAQMVGSSPPPASTSWQSYVRWFYSMLGYEGYIVGQRRNQFLVAGQLSNSHKTAFVFKDTRSRLVLSGQLEGAALLKLESHSPRWSVYSLLLKDRTGQPVIGDKLIFSD